MVMSDESRTSAVASVGVHLINPFSDVESHSIMCSSSEEDDEAADEGGEDSSSLSDSSSQIVSLRHRPRQRVRLLATFRLSSLPFAASSAEPQPAGADPDVVLQAQCGDDSDVLQVSATIHKLKHGVPRMVMLDKETDLTISPPDWRSAAAPGALSTSTMLITAPPDNDSAAMADALAALAGLGTEDGRHDFVASASTMKTIFGLPCSNASVTVAVHRVDNKTLVLNGVINGEPRLSREFSLARSSSPNIHSEHTNSPRISSGDGDIAIVDAAGLGKKETTRKKKKNRADRQKKRTDTVTSISAQTEQQASLFSKFMYYSASAPDDPAEPSLEKAIEDGLIHAATEEEQEDTHTHDEHAERMLGSRSADGAVNGNGEAQDGGEVFRRAVHFEFHDLNLLLGSDTVIFNRGARTSELSLRLQDTDSEIPKLTCLDYWLDNIFNQVSQTAVCYHKEGKVHGYQLVRTQDIPTWSGSFAFEPKAVMESASSILHFLQTNCTKEAGTYWLCRPAGSSEIQLFCLDDADGRQRTALSQPVGLLCFKIARRLQLQDREACAAGGACKQRQRTARLFCNAIAVLDELLHPTVVSLSHEGLADAMVGAEWAAPKATKQADGAQDSEPEREAEFYVDENGDLQDAKCAGGDVDEDDTARPSVGDTAEWGAAYSLADLENAESHYLEAAAVRHIPLSTLETQDCSSSTGTNTHTWAHAHTEKCEREEGVGEDDGMVAVVSRRLRCKAAKCGIAIGIRLLRKGAVADALIKTVNAFDRCVGGHSREEQEVVSEAMEVWADVHVHLAALTRDQVLKVREQIKDIQEQELFLSSGTFEYSDLSFHQHPSENKARRDMTPLSHPLGPDIEDNSNHAIRYLIRSLQFCNASGRRKDLTNKLASVYSQLGAHYITMGRFTRAHQHYQQGTQLFQSIGDEQSAATLSFKLGQLFAARAHAAPMSRGLTQEQLGDLLKARALVLQAYQALHALVRNPPPYCLARAHRALKEVVLQVQEELGDIDMALAVGKLHSTGWAGKAGATSLILGGGAARGSSGAGDEDSSVENESAHKGLERALSTYELLSLPQAAAAHMHLALFMSRVEAETAAIQAAAILAKPGGAQEDKAAALRAIKTWRQRCERHVQAAAALAKSLGFLDETVRICCFKAELAAKRAVPSGLAAVLESLLELSLLASTSRSATLQAPPTPLPDSSGCASAAHFGEASAGLFAGSGASFARWAPFDGGW